MAQTLDVTFNLKSPTTQFLLSAGLQANPPHRDFQMFRKWGMIAPVTYDRAFNSPIGYFPMGRAGRRRIYITTPKTGEPTIGDKTPLRHKGDGRQRPYDEIVAADFTMPPEPTGTAYQNAIAHAPIYRDVMRAIREWLDHMEYEHIITVAAGMRGNNKRYEVFTTTQDERTDPLPEAFQNISSYNAITTPTRHLAEWQTLDNFLDNDAVGYTSTTRVGGFIDKLADLRTYLDTRSRIEDGYGITPATLRIPAEMTEKKATEMQMDQYVLMISSERANAIVKTEEWKDHQGDLIQAYGLKQGITTGFLGKFHNIVLTSSTLMPTFSVGDDEFCRGLIFGEQAMAVGHLMYSVPVRYKARKEIGTQRSMNLRTPYRCWIKDRNEGKEAVIYCEAGYGVKRLSFQKPGVAGGTYGTDPARPFGGTDSSPPTRVDRGFVAFDLKHG